MQFRLFFRQNFIFSTGETSLEAELKEAESLFKTVDQLLLNASPLLDESVRLSLQLKGDGPNSISQTKHLSSLNLDGAVLLFGTNLHVWC